jgi:tRNA U34 2-thiouridine synthase MnmA/TrmU
VEQGYDVVGITFRGWPQDCRGAAQGDSIGDFFTGEVLKYEVGFWLIEKFAKELGIPIDYIGTGESLDDLEPFDAAAFAEALLG